MVRGRIEVIIPTYDAARYWEALSAGIRAQSLKPDRVIVIDSSSRDGTAGLARRDGFEVVDISPRDFNHGGTRQMGADYAAEASVLIYLTQDAVPFGVDAFANLVRAFDEPEIGAAYGRQLPRENASLIEAHGRHFSYAEAPVVRSWAQRAYGDWLHTTEVPASSVMSNGALAFSTVFDLSRADSVAKTLARVKSPLMEYCKWIDDQYVAQWRAGQ